MMQFMILVCFILVRINEWLKQFLIVNNGYTLPTLDYMLGYLLCG